MKRIVKAEVNERRSQEVKKRWGDMKALRLKKGNTVDRKKWEKKDPSG